RGFYDDNSLYAHRDELASFGLQFSPGVSVNLPTERTLVKASYLFTVNYYEARPKNNVDQIHQFDARLNHRFTERYTVNLDDSFVSTSEPAVVDQGAGAQSSFLRTSDFSAIRNRGAIDFTARLTPIFGVSAGYQNNYYAYAQGGE